MKTTPAQTFTCAYDSKEDRLRLILNYQDPVNRVDFWITRSFLLRLLQLLSKFGHAKEEATLIGGGDYPKNVSQCASSSKTDETTLALTAKEPILLERVDFGKGENGIVHIVFRSPDNNYMSSIKTAEVDALANLLVRTAPTYEWGIGPWWEL